MGKQGCGSIVHSSLYDTGPLHALFALLHLPFRGEPGEVKLDTGTVKYLKKENKKQIAAKITERYIYITVHIATTC